MSSLLLAEHKGYLADAVRLAAFERALSHVVSPGDAVLDLGSGTGVLGLLALRAGARHVYAVDATGMAGVARQVLRANGAADRTTVLRAHSRAVELPERVDVVVADQLGPFGLEAGAYEAAADARARHLRPGGTLVPGRIDQVVAVVELPDAWAEVAFWGDAPSGLDLTALSPLARNVRYFTIAGPGDLLGPAATIASSDPGDPAALPIRGTVTLTVERPGTLHGLAAWFEAHLAPGTSISNGPVTGRLARRHVFLPVDVPVPVVPGHRVEVVLHADHRSDLHRWAITVRGDADEVIARSVHSSLDGIPLTREDLARRSPDLRPMITPSGAARATVLSLCDGQRTRGEIEASVRERHRDLFPDDAAVARFVDRVLASDTA